jgi:hypothetical protein
MPLTDTRSLEIRGISIQVSSSDPRLLAALDFDFALFRHPSATNEKYDLRLSIHSKAKRPTDWGPSLRVGSTRLHLPRNGEQRIGFYGKAWMAYHFRNGYGVIFTDEFDLAYELCHQAILSYCGEKSDRAGAHRIHGLGIRCAETAACLLAPSGGGKSTLASALLQLPEVQIYSDDTPWTERGGYLSAFPLRIALKQLPTDPSLPVREFRRARFPTKWIISGSSFGDRIASPAPTRHIFILIKRPRSDGPAIVPIGRWRLLVPLLVWLVVGWETPQIWQLYLRLSFRDFLAKIRIAGSRLRRAAELLHGAKAFRFYLSEDSERNARDLISALVV